MNIVTAYNERPESRRALDWILTYGPQLAGFHDKMHLHIALTSGSDSPASPNYGSPTLEDALTTELTATKTAHTIHPAGPDAAAQILDLARQERADLVVIGMRRRSATMKLLLGSQVQRIMLDAPCPVVTVKSDTD